AAALAHRFLDREDAPALPRDLLTDRTLVRRVDRPLDDRAVQGAHTAHERRHAHLTPKMPGPRRRKAASKTRKRAPLAASSRPTPRMNGWPTLTLMDVFRSSRRTSFPLSSRWILSNVTSLRRMVVSFVDSSREPSMVNSRWNSPPMA